MASDENRNWRPARVVENRPVARGSMWLALEADDDRPAAYQPGHVLGLGLQEEDGGYVRHAYTVSRGDPARRRFEHLYRVIPEGRMTPRLAELGAGATVYFHGPGHTPIQEEVRAEAKRIAGLATGTGIGPLFGFAEKTLREGEARPLALYIGFREEADFCLVDKLEALAREHANFAWRFTVSRPSNGWAGLKGRLTESVPPLLRDLPAHHFHLVGNGEMVHAVRKALYRAGMQRERVSIETYFNHHADPTEAEIDALAARFRDGR
ncbi:MAG: FAD-dependent oxidoreductase [Planctomycetota bacterium]|nr:FAD-dependent oxidoreductase [Planctomycetota bacterium]